MLELIGKMNVAITRLVTARRPFHYYRTDTVRFTKLRENEETRRWRTENHNPLQLLFGVSSGVPFHPSEEKKKKTALKWNVTSRRTTAKNTRPPLYCCLSALCTSRGSRTSGLPLQTFIFSLSKISAAVEKLNPGKKLHNVAMIAFFRATFCDKDLHKHLFRASCSP